MIWDVSNWNEAEWTEDDLIDRMDPALEELDKKKCKRQKNRSYNHAADLFATAIKKRLTLGDQRL